MKLDKKRAARIALKGLTHSYSMHGNPLYAWEAWRIARDSGEPVPGWALAYLDECARRFACMEHPEPKRTPQAVAGAVGMFSRGRGTVFSRARQEGFRESPCGGFELDEKAWIFHEVHRRLIAQEETTLEVAVEEAAAELGLSEAKVKKDYLDARAAYPALRKDRSS